MMLHDLAREFISGRVKKRCGCLMLDQELFSKGSLGERLIMDIVRSR